jgi:hypothetical protein
MRKTLTVTIALALLVGTLGLPAEAQRRKKPRWVPTERTFYLHWDDDGEGGCGGLQHMNLVDQDDPGNGCAFVFQGGQEVLVASGQDKLENEWPASRGARFVLDTRRSIVGDFTVRSLASPHAWLEVTLSGRTGGQSAEIVADESEPFAVVASGQAGPTQVELELELPDELHRKRFTSLTLTTAFRGVTSFPIYIDLNAPSTVTVPILVRRR